MRVLSPRIDYINAQLALGPTGAELAEYAVLLLRIGAVREALKVLDKVDADQTPESLIYRAFCNFNIWEHEKAIPSLSKYLTQTHDPYKILVARLNLAAAYCIQGDYSASRSLLSQCLGEAETTGRWRLFANCLELQAEIAIYLGDVTLAEQNLKRAFEILHLHQNIDQLYVLKWQAYIESLRSNSPEPMGRFRALAFERREWESVREADLFSVKLFPDAAKLDHLTFGTPFPGYIRRIERISGRSTDSQQYLWGDPNGMILEIATGRFHNQQHLPVGRKIHQLLKVLAADFYRPPRIGDLFARLYPGEHFDIQSSPNRIYQILNRARTWLTQTNVPIDIAESRGAYSIKFLGAFAIICQRESTEVSGLRAYVTQLETLFMNGRPFSSNDVCNQLKLKPSRALHVLRLGVREGRIAKSGRSSATRYLIKVPV
jgi:hypothetical protein